MSSGDDSFIPETDSSDHDDYSDAQRKKQAREKRTLEQKIEANLLDAERKRLKKDSMTDDERNAMKVANAESQRQSRQRASISDDANIVQDQLTKLTEEDMTRIYEEVVTALKGLKQHVCSVCDNLVVAKDIKPLNLSSIADNLLEKMRTKLKFPDDLDELLRQNYDVSSFSDVLEGIMLSKRGISVNGNNEIVLTFCTRCLDSLKSRNTTNPPKFAIANGLWIGELPARFHDTTKTEHSLMNLAQANPFMMTVIGGHNRKLSSHVYSFSAEPTVPAAMIPRDILSSGEIKVAIAGSLTSYQKMVLKKKFSVRLERLRDLGEFYKACNHLYANVHFDNLNLNPDLENLDSFIIHELDSEENDLTEYDQQPRHSEQVDDFVGVNSSQIRLSVILDENMNANSGMRRSLGVWRSGKILSDFQKHFWTLTFCDLFPFGRGGLEEDRDIQISMKEYLFNLLRLFSRRFATHESFPAVAYNVIARHNSINAVFLRTHLNPMLAARASTVTSAQFAEQMQYEADFLYARRTNQPLPEQPASCAAVFDLKSGIETGLKAYWGSNQEREDARSNVFSMCNEF